MNSQSRAPAPPPLQMPSRAVTSPLSPTPKSADSQKKQTRYSSDDYADMMASPSSSRGRQNSGSSQGSKKSPYVNANSYCGRHSSQYLFGGHSIGELWRNITKKE